MLHTHSLSLCLYPSHHLSSIPTRMCMCVCVCVCVAGVSVGASVTLTRLMRFLKQQISERPSWQTSTFQAVVNQLRSVRLMSESHSSQFTPHGIICVLSIIAGVVLAVVLRTRCAMGVGYLVRSAVFSTTSAFLLCCARCVQSFHTYASSPCMLCLLYCDLCVVLSHTPCAGGSLVIRSVTSVP